MMLRRFPGPAAAAILFLGAALGQFDYTTFPEPTADDVARGEKIFKGQCAGCHGQSGDGGKGANLVTPRLVYAVDDAMLFRTIRRGIPGTEMPGFGQMSDKEIWQTAVYVKKLGQTPPEKLTGDAARGAKLYAGKGNCAQCHRIGGAGGRMGPALTEIGLKRSASHLRQSLVDPAADLPEGFQWMRVAGPGSKTYTGVRMNEDTFSVQLLENEKVHSFWKSEVTQLTRMWGKSPMPSYKGPLTNGEIEDMVAYLSSLRGDK